jgi:nucleoside-diphosphate-sugar epimerase
MRVFLAGATGAIGGPLIAELQRAGHEVTAISRSPEKVAHLQALGVEAHACDALDADRLTELVVAARPEAVIGQLTDLPAEFTPRAMKRAYEANDRVRGQGTANLQAAAVRAGARRLVIQSIAFWYDPARPGLADEDEPLWHGAPKPLAGAMRTLERCDRSAADAQDIEGLALRYGVFYGPGTWYATDGSFARDVRRRRFPIIGAGAGVTSFLHVEDAASATVSALTRGSPGIYNVVDDEPMDQATWLPLYAVALGAKPPRRVPAWVATLVAGRSAIQYVTRMRGATGARAKDVLGWTPFHRSARQGFDAL